VKPLPDEKLPGEELRRPTMPEEMEPEELERGCRRGAVTVGLRRGAGAGETTVGGVRVGYRSVTDCFGRGVTRGARRGVSTGFLVTSPGATGFVGV